MSHSVSRFDVINLPRTLCLKLLGKDHLPHHRIMVGAGIMMAGVLIAQAGHIFEFVLFKAGCELVGYSFHGIGSVPLLEWLMGDDHGEPPTSGAVPYHVAPARTDVRWG